MMKKNTQYKAHRTTIKLGVMIMFSLFLVVFLVGTTSAFEFDNIKGYDKTEEKITIYNWNILGKLFDIKLAEYTLTDNTDQCLIDCSAEGTARIYTKEVLFSDIRFEDLNKNNKQINNKIFIETIEEVSFENPIYQTECVKEEECIITKTTYETIYENKTYWKEYNFEKLEVGDYKWRIEGTKDKFENIDWIGSSFGEDFTEWAWWNSNWTRSKEVNVTGGSGSLTNFTVLLNVTYDSDMQNDFEDLRFVNGSCSGIQTDELNYEFDMVINNSSALVWVMFDELVSGNNQICMYYSNPTANNADDGFGAWDSGYVGIFHFTEGSGTTTKDTVTQFNFSFPGASANPTWINSRQGLGKSLDFDGGDFIDLASANTLVDVTTRPVTVEALIYVDAERTNNRIIGGENNGWDTGTGTLNTWRYGHSGVAGVYGSGTASLSTAYNYSVTHVSNSVRWYINNVADSNNPQSLSTGYSSVDYRIGSYFGGGNWNGEIDELRVSNVERTTDWMSRTLDNQDKGFVIFGLERQNGITTNLISPIEGFNFSSNEVNFSVNSIPDNSVNLTNITLYIWNNTGELYLTNFTSLSGIETIKTNWTMNISDGSFIWNALTKGTNNIESWANSNRTFNIDATPPSINLTSPTGDQGTFASGINLSLDWTVIDSNQDTCWYDYEGSNTTVTCSENSTNLTVTDSTLTSLIFWANDTTGNIDSNSTSWSYSFIEQNVTYNVNVSETLEQSFIINMTTAINVLSISSFLHYNNTDYPSTATCSGSNCTLINSFDIPLIQSGESQINVFHWNITIYNGTTSTNLETSSRNQNVSRIHLEECGGAYTVKTLNFTVSNEINLTRVNPFRFDGSFDFWLGNGGVKRNNSFSNSSTNEFNLCISPNNTMFTDAQIEYNEPLNITFVTRNYFFQNNTINNSLNNISLSLLPSASSTTFILKVQDDNILPLADHIILIQRYYPGEDKFRTIQISKTDDNGKTLGFFETETVDYRFIIMKDNKVLLTTSKQKIFGEEVPFTLTFTIGEDLGKPWVKLEDPSDITFNLFFNKTTNIVTYTYTDSDSDFTLGRLVVERLNLSFSTNNVICNLNSSLTSATLTCDVGTLTGNTTGTYIASGLTTRNGVETIVEVKSFIIETITSIIGLLGVFMAFFIILISSFAFKFNEIAGIFMINASIIFVNIIGLVSFGSLAITAIIAVSIIIVAVIER